MHSRPVIGLLTNDLVGTYQYLLWSGMKAAAAQEDCDLVSFNVGEIASSDPKKFLRNACVGLVPSAQLDALVVLSPVFSNSASRELMESALAKLGPIPLITVGFSIPGHPSILVDNREGMAALVEHLVLVHRRRNLVFLGGPACNPDAFERREAYFGVLKAQRIPIDPRRELSGEFDFGIAQAAVRDFLETGLPVDGIVSANDEMAMAAMEALRERGLRIPDDVSVVGFDDIDDSRWAYPALSTVHQPMMEQGVEAVRIALDLLEGRASAETLNPRSVPVFRDSCGCRSEAIQAVRKHRGESSCSIVDSATFGSAEHLDAVRDKTSWMIPTPRLAEAIVQLVESLARDCLEGTDEETLRTFRFLIDVGSRPADSAEHWQMFISNLRAASMPFLQNDHAMAQEFDGILHLLRLVIHERSYQQFGHRMLQSQRGARDVHEVGHSLASARDENEISEILAAKAKLLKISSIHLLLRDPAVPEGTFRLQLSIQKGVRRELPRCGELMSFADFSRKIVRESALRSEVVVEPLHFQGVQLGVVSLELAARRGMLLDSLRGLVSASLYSTDLADSLPSEDP